MSKRDSVKRRLKDNVDPTRPKVVWTEEMLELVLEAYMNLLSHGGNKLQTARDLAFTLGVSRPCIELVWGNISYVRDVLGLPWLRGQPPRKHVNRQLFDLLTK